MAKYVKKNEGKTVQAWKLGAASEMERKLMEEGKIVFHEELEFDSEGKQIPQYELFSSESNSGQGQRTVAGDFFKVDGKGNPYPQERQKFLTDHRHIEGDTWEQLPKPLLAWETGDEVTPEVQFLIDHKGLVLSPQNPEQYFGAMLWGAWLTAAQDAVLIFYGVSYAEDGSILDADFNFVMREHFTEQYRYC